MASEVRDWSVPAPVRALVWWPAIAFVLVVVAPDASVGLIIGAGLVLTAFSLLVSVMRRRPSGMIAVPAAVETTIEFPTMEMPRITDERAA